MKCLIKDLKKHDKFEFNHKILTVIKKYNSEDSPLKATSNKPHKHPTLNLPWQGGPEIFDYDELEIDKITIFEIENRLMDARKSERQKIADQVRAMKIDEITDAGTIADVILEGGK